MLELVLLLLCVDELLFELLLFEFVLFELLALAPAPGPIDGVCLMCDDFVPLVELDVEFVVLLFDDVDVEWLFELLELRDDDVVELPDDFELFKFDEDEVVEV